MTDFSGKVVLVTGGTRGIGKACAERFAREGASVALCGRNEDTAKEAAQSIASETDGKVEGYQADIAKSEDIDAMISAIEKDLGPVGVLVNNAGITRDGLVMRMKDEAWSEVIETNLNGAFYCCRAVCRGMMKARAGRIINVSSIVGIRGQGGQTNYAAAKAGLIGFTKSLAQELAPRNITANVVAPGFIETAMTAELGEDAHAKIIASIPAGREGAPEDIAGAVAFLASDDAAYITGHVLCVDGGLAM